MSNPFEDEDGRYHVLINAEEQYSLWPAFAEIPAGWSAVIENSSRRDCLDYIDETWTDMRPKSLVQAMAAAADARPAQA